MKNSRAIMALAVVGMLSMLPAMATATVVFSDDFSGLSGYTTNNGKQVIGSVGDATAWWGAGPESKAYNSVDANSTSFAGKLGWDASGNTSFDSAAVSFSSQTLSVGQSITLTMDYTTRTTLDKALGVRFRIYDDDAADIFAVANSGYGVSMATGTHLGGGTGQARYYDMTGSAAFGTGTFEAAALAQNTATNGFGLGGTFTMTVARTGASEATLSGAWSGAAGNFSFDDVVVTENNFTFDALGVSVGSIDHGIEIDNVSLTVIPEPATLGLLGLAGLGLFVSRRLRK